MSFFHQALIDQLYLAEEGNGTRGSLALVLPDPAKETEIDLETALHSAKLAGIFVFATRTLAFASADEARQFVETILTHTSRRRAMVWVLDPTRITHETAPFMELASDGQSITTELLADLTPTLQFVVRAGIKLTLASSTSTVVDIGESTGTIPMEFAGSARPVASLVTTGQLPFAGSWRGCFQFQIFIQRQSLSQQLNWGFQFLFPGADRAKEVLSEWLPLASSDDPDADDMLGFQVTLDPCDVFNEVFDPCVKPDAPCDLVQAYNSRRTFFTFTGSNSMAEPGPTILTSYYRTIYGQTIRLRPVGAATGEATLLPARLVLASREGTLAGAPLFHLSPEGDFELEVQDAAAGALYELLCGLHGDEFLRFASRTATTPGEFLRFLSRQPAFAPAYPFEMVSPVGPPVDPTASLLSHRLLTSWATLVGNPVSGFLPYVAQPQGSALFGKDTLIQPNAPTLLGHVTPGGPYPGDATTVFPLPPYAGAQPGDGQTSFSGDQIGLFEREVIAPTRRRIIGDMARRLQAKKPAPVSSGVADTMQHFTTPSGLISTLTCNGQGACWWSLILLGLNTRPHPRRMYFTDPDEYLVQAFQTNQLFLVVANATHLGQLVGDGPATGRAFWNQMNIEDWLLEAQVGQQNHYANYRDVLIIKGRRGKLYDPQDSDAENLVANPAQWTQSTAFAAPTTVEQLDTSDPRQLVVLSQWLQDFFHDASLQRKTTFYEHFNRIATDENWTGILILKMQVRQMPDALTGLISGIRSPEAFYAHHFAIEINQMQITQQGDIGLEDSSSMFGLISYLDPACDPAQPDLPVPSTTGAPCDFRLLRLQVLFENTAIKQFRSTAQLTLNELFHTLVDHMGEGGNPYNALMLHGSYQQNDGQGLYSLNSMGSNIFYLQHNVLKKVEITSVQMSTRDPGKENAIISWFALNGFLDFAQLHQANEQGEKTPFDIFSFGNLDGEDLPRKGLSFANLGIQLTYPLDQEQAQQDFTIKTDEMVFDLTTSTPRPASLFVNFGLQVQGLVSGDQDATPAKAGYLPVIPDLRLAGVEGGPWYGLRFRLNLGTPGDLAGKVGLNAYLLTAWSPTSNGENTYRTLVGLELPGTGGGAQLISLQTVLKLSLGQIRLAYLQEQQSFLLMFNEIALRFLGLLKIPPGGNTTFYLFGNPQSGGEPAGLGWYAMYKKSSKANIPGLTGKEKEYLS